MNILLTNDDGIQAPGIKALAARFGAEHNVLVVAPNKQMSATSSAITTARPLRFKWHELPGAKAAIALEGTPADCVKFALNKAFPKHFGQNPDIVLSGINHGRNTGINVLYSGTLAAASEGALAGIPSVAVSLSTHDTGFSAEAAAEAAWTIIQKLHPVLLFEEPVPMTGFFKAPLININVPALPAAEFKGIIACPVGSSYWEDEYERRLDPYGNPYFWFNGTYLYDAAEGTTARLELTDDQAVDAGYVAVSALRLEYTDTAMLAPIAALLATKPQPAEPDADTPYLAAEQEIERILGENE